MLEVAHRTRFEDRIQQVRQAVTERLHHEPDWVKFYRELLGVDGLVDQLFPTFEERCRFERTEQYAEIQQMLAKLREKAKPSKENGDEPTRVITVRLPQSLHEALRHEAHHHKTSMNKLCISKLLQMIEDELVPSDFERRDGDRTVRLQPLPRVALDVTQVGEVEAPKSGMESAVPAEEPPAPRLYHDSMSGRPF